MKKCKHKRNPEFCCECRYGKIREESTRNFDAVDELKSPDGYKLMKGHFGDIKEKND